MTEPGRTVLEGAFALLEELTKVEEAGLTRLAAGAGLPKATAHRLLEQLTALGAVRRHAGRYRMGAGAFRFGQVFKPAAVLREAARRPLRELALAIPRANVFVGVPEAGRTVLVTGIAGALDNLVPLPAGQLMPPGNPADLVLAAHRPDAEPPEGYSAREWIRLAAAARDQGVVVGEPHPEMPLTCLAAPVRAPSGHVVAVVGVGALDCKRSPADQVRRAAGLVSATLAGLLRPGQTLFPN